MQRAVLFALAGILVGCATPKLGYYGGDGSSSQRPIVAVMRGDQQNGYGSPERWLQQKYPGSHITPEAVVGYGFSPELQVYRVRTRDGRVIVVWFKVKCIHCIEVT
jgi:hypothetical protein